MATPLPLAGDAVSFPIHLGIGAILQKPGRLLAGSHLGAMLTAIALTNKSRNLNRTVRSTALLAKRGKGWK
jgi:hypothetical protein